MRRALQITSLAHSVRHLSSATTAITTPIFYVNAKPHIGHFYSMTLADVYDRWLQFSGRDTFFTTGTDEHGLKVQTAAQKAGVDPKLFCDGLSEKFKILAQIGDIKYDRFIRTTDPDHVAAVTHFWKIVQEKGYLYKGQHSGWYSVSDEAFYAESEIEEVEEAGVTRTIATSTGSEVTFETEENYFFKLSKFQPKLLAFLESNPGFIQPQTYYEQLLRDLRTNQLSDLSVSRPTWRLKWGIDVPGDEGQKMYVWFDALVNYLTSAGYPAAATDLPRFTHVIGKEITKFHCVHWPAFLMAAELPLPEKVVVHGHWLMSGRKMSKSRGNVADPLEIASKYDVDALRLFMMRNSTLRDDSDYSEEKLNMTRTEFIDKFCNLMTRSLSKNFNISRALQRVEEVGGVEKLLERVGDEEAASSLAEDLSQHHVAVNALRHNVAGDFEKLEMHRSISTLWSLIRQANALFDKHEPWKLKGPDEVLQLRQDLLIFTALDTLRVVLILLQAVIPNYTSMLLDRMKVNPSKRTWDYAAVGADTTYGEGAAFKKGEKVPIQKVDL